MSSSTGFVVVVCLLLLLFFAGFFLGGGGGADGHYMWSICAQSVTIIVEPQKTSTFVLYVSLRYAVVGTDSQMLFFF